MKVRNAANHGCGGDKVVAICNQFLQQLGILGIAFDEGVSRIGVVRFFRPSVFAEVVEADYLVPGVEQLFDQISTDKTG